MSNSFNNKSMIAVSNAHRTKKKLCIHRIEQVWGIYQKISRWGGIKKSSSSGCANENVEPRYHASVSLTNTPTAVIVWLKQKLFSTLALYLKWFETIWIDLSIIHFIHTGNLREALGNFFVWSIVHCRMNFNQFSFVLCREDI